MNDSVVFLSLMAGLGICVSVLLINIVSGILSKRRKF
jgi:hypothetical protein